jgi:UDP-N-acetylmuramoylalanine--D-glutamate ligase
MESADLIVISPGVPSFAELEAAERAGVPIWGEIELATRELLHPAPIVAIGGTNGKSTTTSIVGALLEAAGKKTFTGGNLGEPLADHADDAFDAIVLEVSSFQMERVETFKPKVSVLLNVTPDHLDRYADLDAYARAKGNAFARQTEDDLAVVPEDDAVCMAQAKRGRARVVTFGDLPAAYRDARMALAGKHNARNAAAAIAAIEPFDVSPATIRRVLATFKGLPHRTALVAEIAGVRYYDDSKGTNVDASVTALLGLDEERAVLVAGGRDKGGSYEPLVRALEKKGRAAVLIGEAADSIARAIGDRVTVHRAKTMDDAVRASAELAKPGDAVLLSPACSSFDMFRDYKHRGDEFVRAVRALAEARC